MFAVMFNPTSYLGIVVFLVLTGCGLPIPEEVAFVVAGVLSAEGRLNPGMALAACLVGALLGDSVMYFIGHRWGRSLLSVHPRLAKLLHTEREPMFEEAIQRHAFKVMLLSRFLVGVRGPVYVAAGAIRMPYRRFLMIDMICSSLVVVTVFSLSYFFGDRVVGWVRDAELTATLIVAVVAAIIGIFLYRRSRTKISEIMIGQQTLQKVNPHPALRGRSPRSAQ